VVNLDYLTVLPADAAGAIGQKENLCCYIAWYCYAILLGSGHPSVIREMADNQKGGLVDLT